MTLKCNDYRSDVRARPRTSLFTWIFGGMFTVVVFNAVLASDQPNRPQEAKQKDPATEARDQQRGAASMAVKSLKDSMHDPDSFKLDEAFLTPDGAGCYIYRAKNGFGATRIGYALMTPERKIYSSSQGRSFNDRWNKVCAGRTGETLTAYINMFVL